MWGSMKQFADVEEVLRILIIALPYSGAQKVAKVLQQDYDCKIFEAKIQNKPANKSLKKYVREICFQQFGQTPRAVVLTTYFSDQIILQLRKRNYLNVLQVDCSFKQRYQYYLEEKGLQDSMEVVKQFMNIDEQARTQEYYKCLEFIRVRVTNRGTPQTLIQEIKNKKKEIIRFFRPTWDQYFMKIADIARRRSNCMKTSVGAVIVNADNRVVSTGYNGTPKGITSCYKMGCQRCNSNQGKQLDQCLCLHAEQSAIIEVGIGKTHGCRLYTTYYPCFSCAKIIIQAGIKRIYYMDEYQKQDSGKSYIEEYFKPCDVVKISVDNLYY